MQLPFYIGNVLARINRSNIADYDLMKSVNRNTCEYYRKINLSNVIGASTKACSLRKKTNYNE